MSESVPREPSGVRGAVVAILTLLLTAFVLVEVNRPALTPQAQLAAFALFGLPLCFLIRMRPGDPWWRRGIDLLGLLSAVAACAYVLYWSGFGPTTLGDRAGGETGLDIALGLLGLFGVLAATARVIGPALPILAGLFLLYAVIGPHLPELLFPHRGYSLARIASQGFLQSQGVFGIAMKVMFAYVFLFVVFGAMLQATGAIRFITTSARRLFLGTVGGAAKVSVVANAMMGSLSGSAVADAATTGTVTIPLMRSTGFTARAAAGITAAASSGAALVPPVMGAAAYMMLELVDPPVSYLQVVQAAILPALLYYVALIAMVHLHARRHLAADIAESGLEEATGKVPVQAGIVFGVGLVSLVVALIAGRTVFRAVSVALLIVVLASLWHRSTRPDLRKLLDALSRIAQGAAPLVAAAGAVGIILGMVTLTGLGTRFPAAVLSVAGEGLLPALLLIMVGSVVLGMGLPSAVCYLLMAILIGPVIGQLGVPPLSVHFFIFYFGMMSMVTPPVALAAYTTAGIANTPIIPAALTAFRYALAGFALPYFFVFRPELLLILDTGRGVPGAIVAVVLGSAVVLLLSAGIVGWLFGPLTAPVRAAALTAAGLLLWPPPADGLFALPNLLGIAALAALLLFAHLGRRRSPAGT
ncbi:MAG: TRAP transporter fused permease subunit [Acidobacteriota bacterium]|nr:TRAP transporter fused permease subunit [Acidobacteriota bacterium]MXW72397.1 TRAP transporter fused permease subunit [Acidobacteriota bacterium]MYE43371.1 TRAP transporter fused permease subunit [Acidobacteriota bacterium]